MPWWSITDTEAARLRYLWRNDECECGHRRREHYAPGVFVTGRCQVPPCLCPGFAWNRATLDR